MDFYDILTVEDKKEKHLVVFPSFKVTRSKDLMVRGGKFYAIWDEMEGLWSTDEYDVQRLIDSELSAALNAAKEIDQGATAKFLGNFDSGMWKKFLSYIDSMSDSFSQLDNQLIFENTEVGKEDHASKRLPYPLEVGDFSAWDELVGTLYSPSERAKLEWAIGSVVSGESRSIQKFLVLYGSAGTGKSTILNVIEALFAGYTATFEAKALTGSNNQFAADVFRNNPLVAIQQDGDLSKIEDNTKLNSITSHDLMTMNEKFKSSYDLRINAFLFMGTNKPVKITDAKSGIIRRLIDVHPTGNTIPFGKYQQLTSKVNFELGAIAHHCLEVYKELGRSFYDGYLPMEMMLQTDVFFNFIEAHFDIFKEQNGVSLKQAYSLYKQFCEETLIEYRLPQYRFREELKNYFEEFHARWKTDNGDLIRSYYHSFDLKKFRQEKIDETPTPLVLDSSDSIFDKEFGSYPAQYSKENGVPEKYWDGSEKTRDGKPYFPKESEICDSVLSELDTSRLHYVRVPENHIVIDFDLTDSDGNKSRELNLDAAGSWPTTYTEYSKSGAGIHLHYTYSGDVDRLSRIFSPGIEIKVFTGNASLRRKLSYCNDEPIATLSSGLPLREKRVVDNETIQSEKGLRTLIEKNLRKEIHPGTKPSIDFIHKILKDAHESGLKYDLNEMRPKVLAFANNSSNQALYCIKLVSQMEFASEEAPEDAGVEPIDGDEGQICFFDVEVFPNLLVVCWKFDGGQDVVKMINPTAEDLEQLMRFNLVGFNNRDYDNHIIYGRYMGMSIPDIYDLSQRIIVRKDKTAKFAAAYGLSYADIYDFSSKKQSLKKFEVELGLVHDEWGGGWDKPIPDSDIDRVAEYCANDVRATEAVFIDREQDFVARQILADISGLKVNDKNSKHLAQIIFGEDLKRGKHKEQFVYTDLSEEFPGYTYSYGKSEYRGEDPSSGGYVWSEPGAYTDVAVLDVASMHPTSIIQLNLWGDYTPKFKALLDARLAIKRGDYGSARTMFGGSLRPYLDNDENAKALSYALKIVINSAYGLTCTNYDNPLRDMRNKDNIVAKRGALFMIDLKNFVQERGFSAVHIKTDSIKIPGATQGLIDEVVEFGKKYGYDFEHEATYERMCLVNKAVYVAKDGDHWEAVGAEFQHPVVYKTLFTDEEPVYDDYKEAKSVKSALYLDFQAQSIDEVDFDKAIFVGKTGEFIPVREGAGGAILVRQQEFEGEIRPYSVTGTKGYFWKEAHVAEGMESLEDLDWRYYDALVADARATIAEFTDVDEFINGGKVEENVGSIV